MNFDDAIRAHSSWKMKLASYLRKPDGSLKASEIQLDNKCELGRWIHGEGIRHANLPQFATLKTEHAAFHQAAAEVVRHADSGKDTAEETALGGKSAFSKASHSVIAALLEMKTSK